MVDHDVPRVLLLQSRRALRAFFDFQAEAKELGNLLSEARRIVFALSALGATLSGGGMLSMGAHFASERLKPNTLCPRPLA